MLYDCVAIDKLQNEFSRCALLCGDATNSKLDSFGIIKHHFQSQKQTGCRYLNYLGCHLAGLLIEEGLCCKFIALVRS